MSWVPPSFPLLGQGLLRLSTGVVCQNVFVKPIIHVDAQAFHAGSHHRMGSSLGLLLVCQTRRACQMEWNWPDHSAGWRDPSEHDIFSAVRARFLGSPHVPLGVR